VHLGWAVQVYNAAEALPNLINPFWMLPLLGVLGLRASRRRGLHVLQLLMHLPVVLFLLWGAGIHARISSADDTMRRPGQTVLGIADGWSAMGLAHREK